MNDRGTIFTKENIGERLSERNFMMNLEAIGLGRKRKNQTTERKNLINSAGLLTEILCRK